MYKCIMYIHTHDCILLVDMGTRGVALVAAALGVVVVTRLWTVLVVRLVWRPYTVARAFTRQGIRGPPYRLFTGNSKEAMAMRAATSSDTLDLSSHDFIPLVMPQYRAWMSLYGAQYMQMEQEFRILTGFWLSS
jgi:cytochrome P450 family 709